MARWVAIETDGKVTGLELTTPGAMETGDAVIAFGNNMGLGLAVTAGIVSAIGKQVVELSDNSTIQLPILQVRTCAEQCVFSVLRVLVDSRGAELHCYCVVLFVPTD